MKLLIMQNYIKCKHIYFNIQALVLQRGFKNVPAETNARKNRTSVARQRSGKNTSAYAVASHNSG
jgi:hypothetical protein